MNTIPDLQAIKFVPDNNLLFKNSAECPCNTMEDFTYIVKPGDETLIQVLRDCSEVELGANATVNGSFEDGTNEIPDNWTLSDSEKVQRASTDPYQGLWSLRWNNPNGSSSATQDTGINFLAGEIWLVKFWAKVVEPVTPYLTSMKLTLGGNEYFFTPTDDYTEIVIPVYFQSNGSDQDIVISHVSVSPTANFIYVDLVTLQKVNYSENNCEFNLIYNSGFEFGQPKTTGESPVAASFDGWTIDNGDIEADLTGGLEGNRAPQFNGLMDTATLMQSLTVMEPGITYRITFWARAANEEAILNFSIAGGSLSEAITLTSVYQEYTFDFTSDDPDQVLQFSTDFDGVYVDDVSVFRLNLVNEDQFYVHDTTNNVFYPAQPTIDEFEGGYNLDYDWETLFGVNTPGCFQIIAEFWNENLIVNGKFTLGTGNVFTGWSQDAGNGTIVQSATGGLNASRAVQMTRNTNIQQIFQLNVLEVGKTYTLSFWAKAITGTPQIRISSINTTFETVIISSTSFKRYSISFITLTGDTAIFFDSMINSTSIIIDNVFIAETGEGVSYSEVFQYDKANGECAPEIVWYDNYPEAFGINYESGFENRMRIGAVNFAAINYVMEDFTKELNGEVTDISKAVVKKERTLNIPRSPEYIHDRLATMCGHSNIEVHSVTSSGYPITRLLCPNEDTVYTVNNPENTGCRLFTATAILAIEGEILGQKSINCP